MSSLTTKRSVIMLSLLGGLLALIASGRSWLDGSLNDGVIASSAVAVTGNQAVPGYFGIALVGTAGVLAAATAGRIARWPAAIVALIASVGLVAVTITVLLDPASAVKSRMTTVTGHSGEAVARGTFTAWFWIAMFASLLCLLAALLALVGVRRWSGLSSRYDAPAEATQASPSDASDWDLMSAGIDPTETATPESHEARGDDTMTQNTSTRGPHEATRGATPAKEN